ncbi:uncharacterized protein LOC128348130 [Hemicordylus capensis]|uniref:uncharacterized protein LOC128348130 n=1 Tax=Hemicordylus capensis TaxID=884348 RepID=UPI002304C563|nr:uncharacterized protein LOC128348130 [Hemicordylus capensis]
MEKSSILSTRPEVLSVENIAKVRNRLASLGALSKALESCLDHAMLKFSREESCLQENARLVVRCEKKQLEFVSGQGESSIEVSTVQRSLHYKVQLPRFGETVKKSPCGHLLLSAENLEKIAAEIVCLREVTKGLKAGLEYAQSRFLQEPIRIQENCCMVIERDGRTLKLVSGDGQNYIYIYPNADGEIQYDIEFASFLDRFVRALTPTTW